jgi:hypothetical protein
MLWCQTFLIRTSDKCLVISYIWTYVTCLMNKLCCILLYICHFPLNKLFNQIYVFMFHVFIVHRSACGYISKIVVRLLLCTGISQVVLWFICTNCEQVMWAAVWCKFTVYCVMCSSWLQSNKVTVYCVLCGTVCTVTAVTKLRYTAYCVAAYCDHIKLQYTMYCVAADWSYKVTVYSVLCSN